MNSRQKLLERIRAEQSSSLRDAVEIADLTTIGVKGGLSPLLTPDSIDDLQAILKLGANESLSFSIIGAGSNLLLTSRISERCLMRLGPGFREIESLGGGRFRAGAAASLMNLSRAVSRDGFSGLEFAGGIPASIGGAVFMNAGAHGSEICQVLESLEGLEDNGTRVLFNASDLKWSYRHSYLPTGFVVTAAVFKLSAGDPSTIAIKQREYLEERRSRQPLTLPSCGSVFKNPAPERPAGMLIEACGLKGYRIGGAQISEKHANWIVNPERSATAEEVLQLIDLCRREVKSKFQLNIEPEVQIW